QLALLETARANAKSDEARRNATQAQDLAARLRTALNEKEKAFRDLERSLQAEHREQARANREAERAKDAEGSERAQRVQAEAARGDAERQRRRAVAAQQAARERLVGLNVAMGTRLVDEGDFISSLPWFAEALCLREGKGPHEEMDRMRLASILQQSP